MTTDRQRAEIEEFLSSVFGEHFRVSTYRDEISVAYPITENGRTRFASAQVYRKFDGRKPITLGEISDVTLKLRDKFSQGTRDVRFTDQARSDYVRALAAIPTIG